MMLKPLQLNITIAYVHSTYQYTLHHCSSVRYIHDHVCPQVIITEKAYPPKTPPPPPKTPPNNQQPRFAVMLWVFGLTSYWGCSRGWGGTGGGRDALWLPW